MTIELPILGLLKDRPMHGYELHKALERTVGSFRNVSWGSLYPMLSKLEKKGYLIKTTGQQERGSERIVYSITPDGEERLIYLLTAENQAKKLSARNEFLMKVAFFHQLSSSQRSWIFEAYRSTLEEKLTQRLKEQERKSDKTNRYRKALLNYAVMRLRTDLEWLDSLILMEKEDNEG